MLSPGEIDVLGIMADDMMLLEQTTVSERWQSFLNPDASRDTVVDAENRNRVVSIDRAERARWPVPVFFRARQGHSCFAHSIERTYAPCEFGTAQCHGHLLHVTSLEAIKESTLGAGTSRHPNKLSGLCKAPGYGLLRLIPTRREFPAEDAEHIPRWLSQRKD
eukprot:7714058-Pyramimonas_sp.AAC.1